MYVPENTKTAGLIRCHACGVEQPEYDKFCRQCGASHRLNIAGVAGGMDWSAGKTRPLLSTKHYDSFSGALVNLVTQGVSARASSLPANRWTMRLASTLVVVPLWLMIVLLSPLDAYVVARAIARRG